MNIKYRYMMDRFVHNIRSNRLISLQAALAVWCVLVFVPAAGAQDMWDNVNGQPGALSRENLDKERPPAPIDLTGTWLIDFSTWMFNPMPKLKPEYQKSFETARKAYKEGKVYHEDVGLCWPPGLPVMMNRVWPINIIQLPTSIVIIANFENQVRWVYMDGRKHTDPDLYVPSYNGESIGHWEGRSLIIDTTNFETKRHWVREGVPVSDKFHVIEKVSLSDDGQTMEIEYTMTDPDIWEGEWVSKKVYHRKDKVDFVEVHCLPDLNEGIMSTHEEYRVE